MTAAPAEWNPYADGTSGHQQGASRAAEPERRSRMTRVLDLVQASGSRGLTWREVQDRLPGLHHGQVTSPLSNLHRSGALALLNERRERCGVYVANEPRFIQGRDTVAHRSFRKPKEVTREQINDVITAWMDATQENEAHLVERIYALVNGK